MRRPVLHRAGRVVAFELAEDDVVARGGLGARHAHQLHQRRVADRVLDGLVGRGGVGGRRPAGRPKTGLRSWGLLAWDCRCPPARRAGPGRGRGAGRRRAASDATRARPCCTHRGAADGPTRSGNGRRSRRRRSRQRHLPRDASSGASRNARPRRAPTASFGACVRSRQPPRRRGRSESLSGDLHAFGPRGGAGARASTWAPTTPSAARRGSRRPGGARPMAFEQRSCSTIRRLLDADCTPTLLLVRWRRAVNRRGTSRLPAAPSSRRRRSAVRGGRYAGCLRAVSPRPASLNTFALGLRARRTGTHHVLIYTWLGSKPAGSGAPSGFPPQVATFTALADAGDAAARRRARTAALG